MKQSKTALLSRSDNKASLYSKNLGFTLIEILIVIAIIAIMSAVVTLNVSSGGDRQFKNDLFKVSAFLSGIADEAAFTNSVIRCDFIDDIKCQNYKNLMWHDLNFAKVASWQWPEHIKIIEIDVNGTPLKSGEKIHFSSSNDMQTTSFKVTDGTHTAWIDGDSSGEFKVHY